MISGYPPPDYIAVNWSDELFHLMLEKARERVAQKQSASDDEWVDGTELARRMGIKIKET